MKEEKIKILEIVKDLTSQQVDDLIKNTEKLWKYLCVGSLLEPAVQQKNSKPIIDIINEKVESDKTLKDPLKKEYTKHMLVSNYIENELKKGIQKLCFEIDDKLGVSGEFNKQLQSSLEELFLKNLVPDGDDHCRFSSGDYESKVIDSEPKSIKVNKIILTDRDDKDKEILETLIENKEKDIDSSKIFSSTPVKQSIFHKFPVGKCGKNTDKNLKPLESDERQDFKKIEENVKKFFRDLDKNIPSDEQAL